MAYITIEATDYLIRIGEGRGSFAQIENRRRALDGSLLVDSIATKREVPVEITGPAAAGRFFTAAEANALIATLLAGAVTVSGDVGSFTARASGIGYVDGSDFRTSPPTLYRWVTATLEEV